MRQKENKNNRHFEIVTLKVWNDNVEPGRELVGKIVFANEHLFIQKAMQSFSRAERQALEPIGPVARCWVDTGGGPSTAGGIVIPRLQWAISWCVRREWVSWRLQPRRKSAEARFRLTGTLSKGLVGIRVDIAQEPRLVGSRIPATIGTVPRTAVSSILRPSIWLAILAVRQRITL